MTEREAQAILDGYKEHVDDEGYCYRKAVSLHEESYSFGKKGLRFVMWPYSDEYPLEKDYAFMCQVLEDGEIVSHNAPMKPQEAVALYERSFPE